MWQKITVYDKLGQFRAQLHKLIWRPKSQLFKRSCPFKGQGSKRITFCVFMEKTLLRELNKRTKSVYIKLNRYVFNIENISSLLQNLALALSA
jgi:hypothetical protein